MAHALLDAYDRADEKAVADAIAAAFVLVDDGSVTDRQEMLREVHARHERHSQRSRDYSHEQVWVGRGSVVFFGETVEHWGPDGRRPLGDFDGWNTIVWTHEGGAWKAASWQWIKGGLEAERADWNGTYRISQAGKDHTATGRGYRPEPNAFLVDMVRGRKPGLALDVAMGQGRNALYLAERGWQVTGFDISDEGLREAREAADARHLPLEAVNAVAAAWDFGTERWDLVTFIYAAGCPRAREHGCDEQTVEKVRRGLRRGGMVVVEGFHRDEVPGIGFGTGELADLFKDGFTVVRDDVIEEASDWSNQLGLPAKLVRFAATKK
ncbi:MAG TPA: class I SAM-dependent methyltransferase [Polyangiaceae bacterium]|nr:class I SAM-dependent methyltransferase [Polyangiaceae bacterium]